MCNAYRINSTPAQLIADLGLPQDSQPPAIVGEYFPGRPAPVVYQGSGGRQLRQMTWGFPPHKGKRPINNTRCETASTSPFWKRHLSHRCVMPVSCVIEWQHQVNRQTGELRKLPHTIRFRDNRLAAVASIYKPGHDESYCSMMTCRANHFWSTIHNKDPDDPRMVCFLLDAEAISTWLDPRRPYDAVDHLLQPVPDEADLLHAQPLNGGHGQRLLFE